MDYACALTNQHCYISAIESMLGIAVPERAEYLRVITSELNRIASHLLWLGAYLLDLGAFTPILYCFDDREQILDILEDVTGSRLTHCWYRAGGVAGDVPGDFSERIRAFVRRMHGRFSVYKNLVTDNVIFLKRTRDIGIITADMARRYGATGPTLRGSGIAFDIRKSRPYSVYPQLDFEVPVGEAGDCLDRYVVHIEEMRQSLRILEQCLDRLPEGEVRAKLPKKMALPAGDCTFSTEGARGEVTYYLAGDGTETPYRLKVRSPCFSNLSLLPELCRDMLLADMVSAMGSLDLVIPEIDR
jgi:NADH-quinone oxidoreductase subunit D